MTTGVATALWLVPEGEAEIYFQETIERLAHEHGGVVFAPHLTLGLGAVELLDKVSSPPIELSVIGLDCSPRYTKTLFIRFALSPALAELRDSLGMDADGFDPHLSLLYAEMPMTQKIRLRDSLPVPFKKVLFAAAEAVRCSLPVATAADVIAWKSVARRRLA